MAANQSMDQRVFYAVTEAIQRLGYSTMKPEQLQVVSLLTIFFHRGTTCLNAWDAQIPPLCWLCYVATSKARQ